MAGSDSDDEDVDSDDEDVDSDEAKRILRPATAMKAAKPKAAAGGGGRRRGRAQTGGSSRSSTKRAKTILTFDALHHMEEHTQGLYVLQGLQEQDLIDLHGACTQLAFRGRGTGGGAHFSA